MITTSFFNVITLDLNTLEPLVTKALDFCQLEGFLLLLQPHRHSLLDIIIVEPPPPQRGLELAEQKVVTGGQVRTVILMIELLEAAVPQSSQGTEGLMDRSVVVEEEETTGQLVPPLLTDRVSQATEYFGVALPRDRRSVRQEVNQQHSLAVPEDGGHDLASRWLGPKFEWCRGSLVFPGHALELCLWVPVVNPRFITCHDPRLKSRWVCIVQSQHFLRTCAALKAIMQRKIFQFPTKFPPP